jgi:hypothetical protein
MDRQGSAAAGARDLQPTWAMRVIAAVAALGAMWMFPMSASAQDKVAPRPAHVRPDGRPVVSVSPVLSADDASDDVTVAAKRFVDEWSERLRPIEQRLREDGRVRRAGAVVGLSAAAIGAVRGQQTLTFVGTQALRLGLDRQLSAVQARTGFVVAPSIGHRSFSVTISKNLR